MLKRPEKLTEFDFFMDEDTRARRIGVLCMHKILTPALTQALFRIKESAYDFHEQRIKSLDLDKKSRSSELASTRRQIREIKWSELNLIRSFIGIEFLKTFFHYCCKGPLPIAFFNTPFKDTHKNSISYFFQELPKLKVPDLNNLHNSESVFFLDMFTTASGFRFEEVVRDANNLSRCFRIDSRAHDLMQLADLLLGITVHLEFNKKTRNKSKLRVLNSYEFELKYTNKKRPSNKSVYWIN